jgi:hypothetical protein
MLLRTRTEIREIAHAISLTAHQDTSNVTINVYKNYRYIPRKQLKLKLVFFDVYFDISFSPARSGMPASKSKLH